MPERGLESDEFEALAVDILSANHSLRFRAHGGSMRPFIQNNDIIEVEAITPGALKRGDVILCRLANGRLLVHRIVRLGLKAAMVQGDARAMPDGWVPLPQILGRAAVLDRNGRRFRFDSPWVTAAGRLWMALAPLRRLLINWLHIS